MTKQFMFSDLIIIELKCCVLLIACKNKQETCILTNINDINNKDIKISFTRLKLIQDYCEIEIIHKKHDFEKI